MPRFGSSYLFVLVSYKCGNWCSLLFRPDVFVAAFEFSEVSSFGISCDLRGINDLYIDSDQIENNLELNSHQIEKNLESGSDQI